MATVSPPGKLGLSTVTSEDFLPGTIVMLHSFLKHNPWFDGEIIVVYEHLSNESINVLQSNFRNLNLHRLSIELSRLLDKVCSEVPWLKSRRLQFGSLEILSFNEIDRLVFCDSDLLFLGSIEKLLNTSDLLICCGDGPNLRGKVRSATDFSEQKAGLGSSHQLTETFSSGFMIIDSKLLTAKNYRSVLSMICRERWESDTSGHTDQMLFNLIFSGTQSLVSPKYNFSLSHQDDIKSKFDIKLSEVRAFHFTGALKPWLSEKILQNRRTDNAYIYALQKWNEQFISFLISQNSRATHGIS